MNDVGDDWFYDDYEPAQRHEDEQPDLYEFEWMEQLKRLDEESKEDRKREEEIERRYRAGKKAAETRKLNRWKKEDEERRLRRGRHFRSIDAEWEST